jgi:uncharacterized protein with WD repeat
VKGGRSFSDGCGAMLWCIDPSTSPIRVRCYMTGQRSLLAVVALVGLTTLTTGRAAEAPEEILVKSPNGDQVAFASKTVIEVRDAETKKLMWRQRSKADVRALAYTPDGKGLAAADRAGTVLIEAASGKLIWSAMTPPNVKELLFSEDGKQLLVKAPKIRDMVFDVRTGKRLE